MLGKIDSLYIFEYMLHQTLEHLYHIVLFHEAHFAVNLSELRLTVGAEVFVAEALGNLEIAVIAAHHEKLLEDLRALWQGIELSGIHTRGHHEVSGAFGSGLH